MPTLKFKLPLLSEEESKQMASKQILPFLALGGDQAEILPGERRSLALSKSLFSLSALTETAFLEDEGPLFRWTTRPIYDTDDRLLFYDHTLPLASGNELRVRGAASELLRTPIWSVRTGRAINFDGLISKARSVIDAHPNLEPVLAEGESELRLVCYGYPRMGVLCASSTQPSSRFVVDLWDLEIKPLEPSDPLDVRAESTRTIWSPYDFVLPGTIGDRRERWERNNNFLKEAVDVPKRVKDLPAAIKKAGGTIARIGTTRPELKVIGQQTDFFCAVATAKMIFDYHHEPPKTQDEIAFAMQTLVDGTRPQQQSDAILLLTELRFKGELDPSATFKEAEKEITDNLPFRTGSVSHARACGGFLVEGSGKEWLYLYDPAPTKIGDIYYEAWDTGLHKNYIYVRPVLFM